MIVTFLKILDKVINTRVAKLVNALVLNTNGAILAGSIPAPSTKK